MAILLSRRPVAVEAVSWRCLIVWRLIGGCTSRCSFANQLTCRGFQLLRVSGLSSCSSLTDCSFGQRLPGLTCSAFTCSELRGSFKSSRAKETGHSLRLCVWLTIIRVRFLESFSYSYITRNDQIVMHLNKTVNQSLLATSHTPPHHRMFPPPVSPAIH